MTSNEIRAHLAHHMIVLESFGFSDLSSIGKLTLGPQGGSNVALLQKSGALFPNPQGSISTNSILINGNAMKIAGNGNFTPINGAALVTNSKHLTSSDQVGKIEELLIDVAYWFGTEIVLQDNTTVVIDSEVKSLFIIAKKLTIGKNVSITWKRPNPASFPTSPIKPSIPTSWEQSTSDYAYPGKVGIDGATPFPLGIHGANAPEIDFWFLQATGFPAIDLRGQDGFQGTRGGDGGDGGSGQRGTNSRKNKVGLCGGEKGGGGPGGTGGRAGNGGKGSNGGNGGIFKVFSTQPSVTSWLQSGLTISVDGGNYGIGGEPGAPGAGGLGGEPGATIHNVCPSNDRGAGPQGQKGSIGTRGSDGNKGIMHSNSIIYTPITTDDFVATLEKPGILSCSPQNAFVGDTVTLNGVRFTKEDKVLIEGLDQQVNVPCKTTFISESMLSFIVPEVPGGYASIQVQQVDGTMSANMVTLLIRPRITEINPSERIKAGKHYFLRGTGLGRTGGIWINGENIGEFTYVDHQTVKFKAFRPSNTEINSAGENVKLKVVNSEGIGSANLNHSAEINLVMDTFHMLAAGDSTIWNGGVPESQKHYTLAANYISSKLGNANIYQQVTAHHGAKLGKTDPVVKGKMHGEMSSRYPTILQQVESLISTTNAGEVDLFIASGGANDIPITDYMLNTNSGQLEALKIDLKNKIQQYCYEDMTYMLRRIVSQFSKAKVLILGYFYIFSEKSDTSAIQNLILSFVENLSNFPNWPNLPSDTTTKIIQLSKLWVEESTICLKKAVDQINSELSTDPRVYFVDGQTTIYNAAHAPNSLLWEPDALGDPTDPIWTTIREPQRAINEVRLKSEGRYGMTKRNSSYHTNINGAMHYFEKMKPFLDQMVKSTTTAVRASNGAYLSAEDGGNGALVAKYWWIGGWETFEMIDLGNSKVAIKSIKGQYVSALDGGGSTVSVDKLKIGNWETFTLEKLSGNKVKFKTYNGKYLSFNPTNSTINSTSSNSLNEIFLVF